MSIRDSEARVRRYLVPRALLALSLSAFLVPGSWLFARPATKSVRPKGRQFSQVNLAKNQWRLAVTNYGSFGHDHVRGGAGGEWPRGSGNLYIYGAGIWFGRIRRTANQVDTNVTVGYNPNSGKAEFTPGAAANAGGGYAGRDFERVYMFPEDWPPDPARFPANMQDSFRTALKVPPTGTGDTIFGWFYPIPRTATSSGDCWSVFNDCDVTLMEQPLIAKSCSIEVYQYTYNWNLPWNQDVVFFVCHVRNIGHDTIKDAYMAMVCDGDIGNANNDYAGLIHAKYIHNATGTDSIWVDNVGMEWSESEVGWERFPGVLGFDFLQSPYKRDSFGRVPGIDGIDNNGNGLIDEPAEGAQIGMTSYKIFTLQAGDPVGDGNQYEAMQGKDWWLTPPPYNPFDSLDNTPADKRFLQSCGPFSIAPDSIVTLTIGVMAAPLRALPSDRDTSFYSLAVTDRAAQQAYDNNWISPVPPPSPNFTLLPGDGRITVMWDNSPETSPDPFYPLSRALKSPYYREYDFQGYKVYRSKTGKTGEWELLAQFDKRDGIVFEDETQPDSVRTKATDNGLAYAYIDSVNIRYGFPYYYAVTSFDYNTLGTPDTAAGTDTTHLTLESGMLPQAIVTRTAPANWMPPTAGVVQTGGNPNLRAVFQPTIITPHAIGSDTYYIRFGEPVYRAGSPFSKPEYNFAVLSGSGETLFPAQSFTIDILNKRPDTTRLSATVFRTVLTKIAYDTNKQLDPRRLYYKVKSSTELRGSDKDGANVTLVRIADWRDRSSGRAAMTPNGNYIIEYPAGGSIIRRHDCVSGRFTELETEIPVTSPAVGCDDQFVYKPIGTRIWRFNISNGLPRDSTDIGMNAPNNMFGVARDTIWVGDDQQTFYGFPVSALNGVSASPAVTWNVGTTDREWLNVAWDGRNYYVLSGNRSPSSIRVFDSQRSGHQDHEVGLNATALLVWANYETWQKLPVVQVGIKLVADSIPMRIFDSVKVETGRYPREKLLLTPLTPGGFYNYLWAYRGNAYRVTWKRHENGRLKPEVFDLDANAYVSYRNVLLAPASPESASGWCLYDSLGPTSARQRVPTETLTPGRTRSLYINGGLIDLNRGRTVEADTLPEEDDVWIIYPLRYAPAPVLATYALMTEPEEFAPTVSALNVKVVPNPYLVRNEWEGHHDFRKLKFINLPNKCTIRIYTLAGDLIRTLYHEETNPKGIAGNIPNQQGGDEDWDLLSAAGQKPAPGIYIFHIESDVGTQVGKFAIVY